MASKKGRRDQGSGSIFKEGSGYRVQVLVGRDHQGKPKYKRVRTKTHAEAVRLVNELTSTAQKGGRIGFAGKVSLVDYLERWLTDVIEPNRSPKTASWYRWIVEHHLGTVSMTPLANVTTAQLQSLVAEKRRAGLAASTIGAIKRCLSSALNHAVDEGLIGFNPSTRLKLPRVESGEPEHLEVEEIKKLLIALKEDEAGRLLRVQLATGLRIGEACGLCWSDIDLIGSRITVRRQLQRLPKQGLVLRDLKTLSSKRTIPLSGDALAALKDEQARQLVAGQRDTEGVVFLTEDGGRWDPRTVHDRLKSCCKRAKIREVGTHVLRSTFATVLARKGTGIKVAQSLLGHTTLSTTAKHYAGILDTASIDAITEIEREYGS